MNRTEWSASLRQFQDASIYQTWPYGAVRWGEENMSHLVLRRNGDLAAVAQVTIRKVPLMKYGIAYIPWGPIWRRKDAELDFRTFRVLIESLKEEYARNRRLQLRIVPNMISTHALDCREFLSQERFQPSGRAYRTLVLDLKPPLSQLRKNLNQKWRNQLNRSEKNGLEVIHGDSEELYVSFQKLYAEMVVRKGFETVVDVEEFGRIQTELDDESKMVIMLCLANNEPAVGLVGSAIGDTGIYLLGATNDTGMKTKGSYLLQWRFIEWLKERNCGLYDLGGIDPEGNPGVYHFKSGITSHDVSHIGEFDFVESIVSSAAVRIGTLLFRDRRNRKGN